MRNLITIYHYRRIFLNGNSLPRRFSETTADGVPRSHTWTALSVSHLSSSNPTNALPYEGLHLDHWLPKCATQILRDPWAVDTFL